MEQVGPSGSFANGAREAKKTASCRLRRLAKSIAEGGLFIGVGAAHLQGREGLVELLRQSGYTVTAVE